MPSLAFTIDSVRAVLRKAWKSTPGPDGVIFRGSVPAAAFRVWSAGFPPTQRTPTGDVSCKHRTAQQHSSALPFVLALHTRQMMTFVGPGGGMRGAGGTSKSSTRRIDHCVVSLAAGKQEAVKLFVFEAVAPPKVPPALLEAAPHRIETGVSRSPGSHPLLNGHHRCCLCPPPPSSSSAALTLRHQDHPLLRPLQRPHPASPAAHRPRSL